MNRLTFGAARGVVGALLFAWASLLAPRPSTADERIRAYDISVEIKADGSLDVTEQIAVRAEGSRIRRGIYRDFPTRYRDRYGNRVVAGFELLDVRRNGQPEPHFTESLANGIRINTGNDDFLRVPADYTFTLRYRTTRQLGFFSDHDELYWNAIGTGWIFPIDQGRVTVRLPTRCAGRGDARRRLHRTAGRAGSGLRGRPARAGAGALALDLVAGAQRRAHDRPQLSQGNRCRNPAGASVSGGCWPTTAASSSRWRASSRCWPFASGAGVRSAAIPAGA